MSQIDWNDRYSAEGIINGTEPNTFLAENASKRVEIQTEASDFAGIDQLELTSEGRPNPDKKKFNSRLTAVAVHDPGRTVLGPFENPVGDPDTRVGAVGIWNIEPTKECYHLRPRPLGHQDLYVRSVWKVYDLQRSLGHLRRR